MDDDNNTVKINIAKEEIENAIFYHDTEYYQQAHQTEIYKDKINSKL